MGVSIHFRHEDESSPYLIVHGVLDALVSVWFDTEALLFIAISCDESGFSVLHLEILLQRLQVCKM